MTHRGAVRYSACVPSRTLACNPVCPTCNPLYLQESVRTFKDLIVVHNLRTITDEQALWHQWRQQVTDMYGEGEEVQVGVAVPGSHPNSPMRMVNMSWFRTHSVRYLCHLWLQFPSPMTAASITTAAASIT